MLRLGDVQVRRRRRLLAAVFGFAKSSATSTPGGADHGGRDPEPAKTSIGAIVGGIVGGAVAIALAGWGILAWRRRRQAQTEAAIASSPEPKIGYYGKAELSSQAAGVREIGGNPVGRSHELDSLVHSQELGGAEVAAELYGGERERAGATRSAHW